MLAVDDKNMLEYIRNKTAAPYFSNLIWFIGNHIIELDECLISQAQSVTILTCTSRSDMCVVTVLLLKPKYVNKN